MAPSINYKILFSTFICRAYSVPVLLNVTIISEDEPDTQNKESMPGAVVVSALILIYILHRAQCVNGFKLERQRHICSDFIFSTALLAITLLWTTIVFYTAFQERWDSNEEGPVCRESYLHCLSSVAAAPWFLLFVGSYWCLDYLRHWSIWGSLLRLIDRWVSAPLVAKLKKLKHKNEKKTDMPDSPKRPTRRQNSRSKTVGFLRWCFSACLPKEAGKMQAATDGQENDNNNQASSGNFPGQECEGRVVLSPAVSDASSSENPSDVADWYHFIGTGGRILLSLLILGATVVLIWSSWSQGLKSLSLISAVGCIIFLSGMSAPNPYTGAPHRYKADTLRVVFPTREERDIVYIFPCEGCGFDAVYCPKVEFEHKEIDRLTKELKRKGRDAEPIWHKDESIFLLFDNFIKLTELTSEDVIYLARWLYCADDDLLKNVFGPHAADIWERYKLGPNVRRYACQKKENAHLIGKNLLYALWLLEFLLYDKRHHLPDELKRISVKFKWRGEMTRISPEIGAVGSQDGRQGYQDAVKYVYLIFGCAMDESLSAALNPVLPRPGTDARKEGDDTDQTIDLIWNHCRQEQDGTFGALYAFSCFWCEHIGYEIPERKVNNGSSGLNATTNSASSSQDNPPSANLKDPSGSELYQVSHGWHHFPLEPIPDTIDRVTWHIMWRQGWFNAIIIQTILLVPDVINTFVSWLWMGAWIGAA